MANHQLNPILEGGGGSGSGNSTQTTITPNSGTRSSVGDIYNGNIGDQGFTGIVYGSDSIGIEGTTGDGGSEIGSTAPDDYHDPSVDCDAVNVSLEFGKASNATDFYWTKDTPLIVKNIVGEGGYFNVKIEYLKRSSVQYAGDSEPTYTGYNVVSTAKYTLEEWIHKATDYEYDSSDGVWEIGNQPTDGFHIDIEDGDINGVSTTGTKRITFTYKCELSGGNYAVVERWFEVEVEAAWYEDLLGTEFSLFPMKAKCPLKATLNNGRVITLAEKDEWFLRAEIVSETAAISTFETAMLAAATNNASLSATVLTDRDTGDYHFLFYGIEVMGKIKNLLDGYSSNATIPENGEVILYQDYDPPIAGSNNIEVTFPCYVAGNADKIDKCHFGIMFGSNNAKNRLFLSGNPERPNIDWHSGETYEGNADFGYFEDLSECAYGATDNAVVGYDIVSNDKLLVLKGWSDKETTVYFRQPTLVAAVNSSGTSVTGINGETLYQEEFALVKGNNSVAGVSPKAVANFNGDSVFLSSDKKIVGLDLVGIVGDNQRYANSRSLFIDNALSEEDISGASLWTDNDFLMLALKDRMFVASKDMRTDAQYEWFPIDVAGVTCVMKKDGKTYLGKSDGGIYAFSDGYRDSKKLYVGYGLTKVSANMSTEIITSADSLASLDTTKEHWFRPIKEDDSEYLYQQIGIAKNGNTADFRVHYSDSTIELVALTDGELDFDKMQSLLRKIKEGVAYYTAGTYGGIPGSTPYYLKEVGDSSHTYKLLDAQGNEVSFSHWPFVDPMEVYIFTRIERPMLMTDIDKTNGTFKLSEDGETVDIWKYNNQSMYAFKGEIVEYSPVEALYITKPFTLGGLEYLKTIWSFTLTNDSGKPSELEVCLASNKIPNEDLKALGKISAPGIGLDFGGFSFTSVDFDKNVVPRTYSSKRIVSGVKFACFAFRSMSASNSVLSSMSVTYTLPFPNYGGD